MVVRISESRTNSGSSFNALPTVIRGEWPTLPDGRGSSLEIIDVHGDPTNPTNWRPSLVFGGSPSASGDELLDRIIVTEILSNTDRPQGDAIELFNSTGEPIDITGWTMSDDDNDLFKFRIEQTTVVPPWWIRGLRPTATRFRV